MSIYERIKEVRSKSGLSQEAFATSINLKRANYAQIELGKQNPTIQTLIEIVRIYNNSYEWLIDGKEPATETAPNIAPIIAPNEQKQVIQLLPKAIIVDRSDKELVSLVPVKAAAGYLNGYADPEYIATLPTLDIPGISGASHRAFEIRGNSMLPNHHSGSIQICRWVETINDIRDRRVYVIVTKHDGIVLKRVLNRIKQDGKLILMSDNDNKREYPNYTIEPEDVLELWYWRAGIIRESPEPGTNYTRINDLEARLSLIESRLIGR
jgi:transcriptional regulator with XRE-family HTH domain